MIIDLAGKTAIVTGSPGGSGRAIAEEVANLCVYAALSQASATTGAALRVEGGIVESVM